MINDLENILPNTLFIGKKIIYLPNCHSTNDEAQSLLEKDDVFEGTTIVTSNQTSGKGQRANRWESEPGKNLTFSIILKPGFIDVKQQFKLNIAVSLGIFDFFSSFFNPYTKIKWPNDVYYKDSKIAGILIENIICSGIIKHSIVGIGINVNQDGIGRRIGNAVSMKMISGKEYLLKILLAELLNFFEKRYLQLKTNKFEVLKSDYIKCLYRYEEKHQYRIMDRELRIGNFKFAKNHIFEGKIIGIDEYGKLGIKIAQPERNGYPKLPGHVIYFGFKEIAFIKKRI